MVFSRSQAKQRINARLPASRLSRSGLVQSLGQAPMGSPITSRRPGVRMLAPLKCIIGIVRKILGSFVPGLCPCRKRYFSCVCASVVGIRPVDGLSLSLFRCAFWHAPNYSLPEPGGLLAYITALINHRSKPPCREAGHIAPERLPPPRQLLPQLMPIPARHLIMPCSLYMSTYAFWQQVAV